jgi:xylulokinase
MFLGIDIGTSAVKAVILDDGNRLVDQASAELTVSRPGPLLSEQDPEAWWGATRRAVAALASRHRGDVVAIGLAGQMHGATVLGAGGEPLRPAILWNDGRSGPECELLETEVATLVEITGNRAMAGFTAPKLMWIRRHEPEVFSRIRRVLLPKDYVRWRLGREFASDMSDSAGTLWLDTGRRQWSDEVLAACGLDRSAMPHLFEGPEVTTLLTASVADDLGLPRVPIVAGAGDNAAAAIGSGVVRRGEALLSLGTSGVIFLADDAFRPHPRGETHTFCHALPRRWHQMSVMLSAGGAVEWAASALGFSSVSELMAAAQSRGEPCQTECFLPYLSGERTPHNDPHAKGVFFGLTASTDRGALAQSVLEGVGLGLRQGLDALRNSGTAIESLSVVGGGSRSAYWGRMLASILEVPLVYRQGATVGPAVGAARLARLGSTGDSVESVCTAPPVEDVVEPVPRLASHYTERTGNFRTLYERLKPCFTENP